MEWEVWLEKGKLRNLITPPDIYDAEIAHVGGKRDREPPVINEDIKTHHAVKDKPKPDKTIPRTIREFDDETHEDPFVNNSTSSVDSWESWLDKNNATETSHKDGEKKVEWDGKFSSSTIEDEVKNEDEKSESEEESLEELTDGDLVEIEKLKSEVDKIITDLTRNIKDPKRREDIVQRQAEQKVKETVTKAWELFLVNKPMNQFDKQPQNKPDEKGLKPAPLTETVPVLNPRGSLGNKKVKRIDHEAGDGSRKIVEIPKEENTNPEVKYKQGGRPESGDQGSVNAGTGRVRGHTIADNAENRSILYNSIEEQRKIDEAKEKEPALPATPKVEKPKTEEEKAAERAASIRQFDRKKRDPKTNKIIKSWENWLEKKSRFKPSNPLHRNIHPHNIPIKDDPYYKNVDLSVDYSQTADARAGDDEYDAIRREKIRREGYHKKSWEGWLDKMQGAGDARFGNQHLTGLDQKPVNNEEDEANILPEKEEKTDDKEEKQEKTDNKPYKALGEE